MRVHSKIREKPVLSVVTSRLETLSIRHAFDVDEFPGKPYSTVDTERFESSHPDQKFLTRQTLSEVQTSQKDRRV